MAGAEHVSSASAWGDAARWDAEYEVASIPSSWRSTPARALTALVPAARLDRSSRVLDLGCGTGRNAAYLASIAASVHAVDASGRAAEAAAERASRNSLANLEVEHALFGLHDLPDREYDFILDAYASCHLLDSAARHVFLNHAMERLAPGGSLLTIGLGFDDSYYQKCRIGSSTIAVDPCNGIAKLLQGSDVGIDDAMALGQLVAARTLVLPDLVDGCVERRQIHATLLTR